MRDLATEFKSAGETKPHDFLAEYWAHPEKDEENLVVLRMGEGAAGGMVLLNKFPYASGHLMAALGEGRPRLLEYAPDQIQSLWRLTEIATELVERTLEPQGVNIGVNQGSAAGAGLPGHLHVHIVPRWSGDVNFLSVVGRVRVIPSSMETMAERFRETWRAMQSG